MGDFDDLLAANQAFAEPFDLGGFDGIAHAGVAIVTCMDSRHRPAANGGPPPGDAKIFRNPGGRVTDAALEALVLGAHLLNVSGSWSSRTPAARWPPTRARAAQAVGDSAGPDAAWQPSASSRTSSPRSRTTCASADPPADPEVGRSSVGFVYDVDTGLLERKL